MSLIIPRSYKRAKAQDAVARNAAYDELNVGDKIWITQYGRNYPYTITKKWKEGWTVWYKVKNDKSGKEEIVAEAFANALDAAADANFKKGDKVLVKTAWAGKRKGVVKEVINDPALKKAYVVEIEGAETAAYPAEIVSADAKDSFAADAKFKVGDKVRRGNQIGIVKDIEKEPYIEVKFNDEPITLFVHERELKISNSRAGDSAELNNDADLRAALSKMADIAKRLTDAKVSFKAGWTPDGIGEIILEFPNIESARKYNYYKLYNAWEAARSQIVPRWAVNIGGYRVPRIEGNRMTIGILHFST